MTKAEEMQRLDEFIAKLPQDSYLRPWLAGIRDSVETDLRNDIIPEHTPRETYRECQQIRNEAAASIRKDLDRKRADAHRIIEAAKIEAGRLVAAAEVEAEEVRKTFRSNIYQLRNALNAVA